MERVLIGGRVTDWRLALGVTALASALVLIVPPPASAIDGCGLNPFCIGGKVVGGTVSGVAGDAITALAQSVLQALGQAVEWTATLWTGIGTPELADANGNAVGAVAFVQQNLLYFTAGLAVFSVLVGAAKIAWEEQKAHHARELARFLVVYGMIAAGSAALGSALVYACDQVAADVIAKATANTSFADHLAALLGVAQSQAGGATGLAGLLGAAFAAIVLGLVAFLTTLVQILLMFVRNGMLVLLIGILPLAAAMSNTEIGMHWLKKAWAWLIAFALYKPAAAVVYAVAFVLPGQSGINALLSGIVMLVLAVLALPALLRFVVPATAAVASGGGTGGFASGIAGSMIGSRMPTGAAPISASGPHGYESAAAGGGGGATGSAAAVPEGPSGIDQPPGGGRAGGGGPPAANGGGGPSGANGGGGPSGPDGGGGPGGANGSPGASSSGGGGGEGGQGWPDTAPRTSTSTAGGGGLAAGAAAGATGNGAGSAAAGWGAPAPGGGAGGQGAGGFGAGGGAAAGGAAGLAGWYAADQARGVIGRAGEQQTDNPGPSGADDQGPSPSGADGRGG